MMAIKRILAHLTHLGLWRTRTHGILDSIDAMPDSQACQP